MTVYDKISTSYTGKYPIIWLFDITFDFRRMVKKLPAAKDSQLSVYAHLLRHNVDQKTAQEFVYGGESEKGKKE